MPHVTWVTVATDIQAGQQRYESRIQQAIIATAPRDWTFTSQPIGSLRSPLPGVRRVPLRLARGSWRSASIVGRLGYAAADLVHRMDLRLPPSGRREVVTVHDLAPLRFPDEGRLPQHWSATAARVEGVICPSKFAAEEVRSILGEVRTWVVPNGVDGRFASNIPATPAELRRLDISSPFVLHVGGATQRKNVASLLAGWPVVAAAVPDVSLVLCGPPSGEREKLLRGIPRAGYIGMLPDGSMPAVVAAARAVVIPSVYEGFGLPALEAMAAGTPVVAAAAASLPEVCGDAAVLVQPDAQSLADGLLSVLTGPTVAAELRRRGRARAASFTWEAAAGGHLAAYREVLGLHG